MKVLMIVDWRVSKAPADNKARQSANIVVAGIPYWFFKYWPLAGLQVDVVGRKNNKLIDILEKKILKFNIFTAIHFFSMRKYDLVICFHSQAGIVLAVMRWLFRVNDPPFALFDIEGIGRINKPIVKGLLRRVIKKISLLFYYASVQKEDYQKRFPDILSRIKFLRWGVDLSRYQSSGEVNEEDLVVSIGYQGRGFRDWETLLDAWRIVSPKRKTKLVIIGREGLCGKEVRGKPIPERVEFIGRLDLEQMNLLIRKARFVVLPLPERRHSYAQMTLMGCLALGKAVVVSKVSGIIDCVKGGETALLCEKANPEDMANKMESLLDDPSLAVNIGKKAREEVEKHYREEQMSGEVYKSIVEILKIQ